VELVHEGSQRSMWALIRIYNRLLERIEDRDYDVLRDRVRVPAWEKGAILLRGMVGRPSAKTAVLRHPA